MAVARGLQPDQFAICIVCCGHDRWGSLRAGAGGGECTHLRERDFELVNSSSASNLIGTITSYGGRRSCANHGRNAVLSDRSHHLTFEFGDGIWMVSRLPCVGGAFEAVLVRLGGFSHLVALPGHDHAR